jgi:hypothetical protein
MIWLGVTIVPKLRALHMTHENVKISLIRALLPFPASCFFNFQFCVTQSPLDMDAAGAALVSFPFPGFTACYHRFLEIEECKDGCKQILSLPYIES